MNGSSVTADFYILPPRQATVLLVVDTYWQTYKRPCPSEAVAGALGKAPRTIREHFSALHRKGWLRSEGSPAIPARPVRPS